MENCFKKIGIIGAGTMGSQLAAMFAGAGCEVELLGRSLTGETVKGIMKSRPPALYSSDDAGRIRVGNIEDHLDRIRDCDWVIESIVEKLDAKRRLLDLIGQHAGPNAIISSNTSSLSLKSLAEGRPEEMRRRLFITHFFNPPRYLKLVEVVGGADADERLVSALSRFLSRSLGKGIVRAKDTPAFIANRVGIFYVMDNFHLAFERGWPLEAVDAVLGRPSGRPKSGVFRLMDMVGLDVVAHVAETVFKGCPHDESVDRFRIPQYLQHMLVNGWLGTKAGRGFFMKCKESGRIKVIDPATLEYRHRLVFDAPSMAGTDSARSSAERIRNTVTANDRAGEIAWPAISRTLVYAAERIPEISPEIADVDRALRWGFNWDLGPFETWDALGVRTVADRLEREGAELPEMVGRMLSAGCSSFYEWREGRGRVFDIGGARMLPLVERRPFSIASRREERGVVAGNESASLVDTGNGIFACEFHSKANAIDEGTLDILDRSIEFVEREGIGLLIANEGEFFSAGADLKSILNAIEKKDWGYIDSLVRRFQETSRRIRFCSKPVMAVPFGKALGGGCEFCLAAPYRTAHVESYMGFVEMAVGLIPAGGGCLNLLLALKERERASRRGSSGLWGAHDDGGPGPGEQAAFEMIATARTSTSAIDAKGLGFLSDSDQIVFDRDLLIERAKRNLIELSREYVAQRPREDIVVSGHGGEMNLQNVVRSYRARGLATEYDALIASKLARVLTDGSVACIHAVKEERILELEREAFMSLVGEERTKERIVHMLKTGRPLRN
jgi:3-hydroxyacyl-CoA dehydrogenase